MKAIREGRVPTAGPPGGEEQELSGEVPNNVTPSISEFPSPPSNFTAPLPPSSPQQPKASTSTPRFDANVPTQPPPPTISQPAPAPAPAPVVVTPHIAAAAAAPAPPTSNVSGAQVANAQKYSKWAISALDYDDIKTARLQLLSALNEIGFNQENNFGY